jgi:DNA (cytosine-5)-methyltransferase 1
MGRAVDLSINHDPSAVEMHTLNHPATWHLCESVWKVDLVRDLVKKYGRGRFTFDTHGRITSGIGVAWFSPDCRHFSRAKGGKPVSKRVRGLAWIVVKTAKVVRPRIMFLENVREFQDWGPLIHAKSAAGELLYDSGGGPVMMPCRDRKGETFRKWIAQIRALGYKVEWRMLDAADYGAHTHRRRLFLIARCDGKPIVWPAKTHGPRGSGLKRWKIAADCIDFSIPCQSIFDRKRPLAEKTMRRIAMGLKRYVLDNPRPFLVKVNHAGNESRVRGVDQPHSTITGSHEDAVVVPSIVRVAHGDGAPGGKPRWGDTAHDVEQPLPTVTGSNDYAMVSAHLTKFRFDSAGAPVDEPMPTITAGGNAGGRPAGAAHALAVTEATLTPYLCEVQNASSENGTRAVDRPAHTITSNPKGGGMAVVAPTLVQVGYGERDGQAPRTLDIEQPLGTVVGGGQKHALVSAFLSKHYTGVVGQEVTEPIGTITSIDHHSVAAAFLAKMNFGEKQWCDVGDPLATITSQGNKFALVYAFMTKYFGTAIGQPLDDALHTVTGKPRFGIVTVTIDGQTYAIVDIGMRMVQPRELANAQGFPPEYILLGSKANQVHKIGNSVCPVMAEALSRANYN